ncbi:alpha/beta-hydrolase [Saitoella complicata NRRL Y-17804]|uniref:Serine aminopeptidase S33 domain-containing protein n=1 Tax=Saitoella complicata (strain BCRC 22490 / CBS 7301 / JCM 7358 / NBRC 10748 / NRRL Y-17804) TaxID=698492 RepID=A0A0E9NQG2_SAICN|nr:alpha/beta-hydrolase [Saitoella complicata NRRL Y-17804]ODQ51313.1 alpha/beta-hydrolase [Saitoella complicata NRRL Y-17804]GAO51665.1 hypothetical protein G7K_5758-t1 [Saitoella complicata NRRL Y-17804]
MSYTVSTSTTYLTPPTSPSHRLYSKTWTPTPAPLARVLFVHGFAEHIERYDHVFQLLASKGVEVVAWDSRGFGRSATEKKEWGVTGGSEVQMGDIQWMVHTHRPDFLWGHSMGGALALAYAIQHGEDPHCPLKGVISSSPLLRQAPSARPWGITLALGSLAAKLRPNHQMKTNLPPRHMTSDPTKQREIQADPLMRDTGTLHGISTMLHFGPSTLSRAHELRIPLLVYHGDGDLVTDYEASREFVEGATGVRGGDKSFVGVPGGAHEVLNEEGWEGVVEMLGGWVLERVGNDKMGDGSPKL